MLTRILVERYVPGTRWIGVGLGMLIGVAVQEVAALFRPSSVLLVIFVAAAVVGDKLTGGVVRNVTGLVAAALSLGRLSVGENCFNVALPSSIAPSVAAAAIIAFLIAVTVGYRPGLSTWITNGFNTMILLFAFVELAVFIVSPAGVPIAALQPALAMFVLFAVITVVAVFTGYAPVVVLEIVGWFLGLSTLFIVAALLADPGLWRCHQGAWLSALSALTGAGAAFVTRYIPNR